MPRNAAETNVPANLDTRAAVHRRRIAGLAVIAIVAGALWVWGGWQQRAQHDAVFTRVLRLCEAIRAGEPSRNHPTLATLSEEEYARIVPVVRRFFVEHVADGEDIDIVVHRGPAELTPRIAATHHATVREPGGVAVHLNIHCSSDGSVIELLGYVREL